MAQTIEQMRIQWAEGDARRDAGLTQPEDIVCFTDIPYGPLPEQLLDVYCPLGTEKPRPAIISSHGGAWFYGDKKLYSHYCMRLARRGFAVVNFDYRLAPEHKYPAPVEDTCRVLKWMQENAESTSASALR